MIRQATLDDIPMVMELGKRFADDAGVTDLVGWKDESVRALLETMVKDHILLVCDGGILGGLLFAHPFNADCIIFQELFWRSEKRGGLKLLQEAERLAKERGATQCLMLSVETMPGAERIYERRGYVPAERSFIKRL